MEKPTLRPATEADIAAMAALWQEKATVQQQNDSRFRLRPDSQEHWSAVTTTWLGDAACHMIVAEDDAEIVGYIIGWIQAAPPGLLPEKVGIVTDLAVGLHSYQSGLGRTLLDALQLWFTEQNITSMLANVPRRQPVEQAFWRALGATELTEVLWLKLT